MEYFLIALGGFLFGVYIQTLGRRERRRERRSPVPADAATRQVESFLRGMKAFEKGVAAQVQRDRRAARVRRWIASRTRVH